jgi:OFA family oxalate/formate antiporter-like MFS transporter
MAYALTRGIKTEPYLARARIAAAGFCMQLALGAVYGWSVFLLPLQERFSATKGEVNLTFAITLAVLGVTAGFGGSLQRRIGPRATATIAGILYGGGVFLSGFAPSLSAVYVSYGVLGGIGLGLGYIVPLAVLIGWFPDRRGFITGFAVAGFGLGAFVTSPLATYLIKSAGVQPAFLMLGIAYFAIVVAAAQLLRPPPDDPIPTAWTASAQQLLPSAHNRSLNEALRTPHWYLLWAMLALNVTAGAALISVASVLAQELTGVGAALGAFVVSVFSLCNGLGRLFWGTLSDRLGRAKTVFLIFSLQIPVFALMPAIHDFALLLLPVAIIALCYGGGFGIMPAFTTDVFGPKNSGAIYGMMLTAWSTGAIAGPLVIISMPYHFALPAIACLLVAGSALAMSFPTTLEPELRQTVPDSTAARLQAKRTQHQQEPLAVPGASWSLLGTGDGGFDRR